MKEVKELVIDTRCWLDVFKDISGVCIANKEPHLELRLARIWDFYEMGIEETATLSEANPLKAMAEAQYCNTNWAVIKYIKALEEQIK